MLKILGLTYYFTPANVVSWWNDIVSTIEAVLSASGLDAYVLFGCVPLLERYARGTAQPGWNSKTGNRKWEMGKINESLI